MRNALSIAAGAWSDTSVPKIELISASKLMSPSAIVTGSISLSTRQTSGFFQSKLRWNGIPALNKTGSGIRNWAMVPSRTPIAYA